MNVIHKLALGAFALGAMVASACSSNEEEAAPSRTPPPPSGEIADAGVADDGGGGGTDGGGSDCFDTTKAKPTTPADFLNQCNDNGCFKFDNSRIEGYTPGGPLPPLN